MPRNKKKAKAKATPTSSGTVPQLQPDKPSPLAGSTTNAPTEPTVLSSSPTAVIGFHTFIKEASVLDIEKFCDVAALTQDGANLKLFWQRAFEEGKMVGREEGYNLWYTAGHDDVYAEAWQDGYEAGLNPDTDEEEVESISASVATTADSPLVGPDALPADTTSQLPTVQTVGTSTQTFPSAYYESAMGPEEIEHLCARAAAASSDTPLGAIWERAFKEGQDEGSRIVDDMHLADVLKTGFEKDQARGIIQEGEQCETAGHCKGCFIVTTPSTADAEAPVNLMPPCTNASVQSLETNSASTAEAGTQVVPLASPLPSHIKVIVQAVSTPDVQTSPPHTDTSTQISADLNPLDDAESVDLLCALSATAPSTTHLDFVGQRAYEAGTRVKLPGNNQVTLPSIDTSTQNVSSSQVTGSIQSAGPSPPPPSQPQTTNQERFDWAEDAESLPIFMSLPLPPNRQPRDLSVLRSSSPSPFSSLQQRVKRSNIHAHRSRRRRNPFHTDFPNPPSQSLRESPSSFTRSRRQPRPHGPTMNRLWEQEPSHLNWDDPRLSDLSCALKALGWILAR